jgi:murein DD-endopeptidase MepM/ murein hydrolase activator NlpD
LGKEDKWYRIDISESWPEEQIPLFHVGIVNTNSSALALRSGTAGNARNIAWMPKGSRIQFLETHGNWTLIKFADKIGYAFSRYLKKDETKEEYWFSDQNFASVPGLETIMEKARNRMAATPPPTPKERFNYLRLLNLSLENLNESQVGAYVTEMQRQVEILQQTADIEPELKEKIKKFQEQNIKNIRKEQEAAERFLKEENLPKAALYARIGAFKTQYRNVENLKLLQRILLAQAEDEKNTERKNSLLSEANFITRSISDETSELPYQLDFSEPGTPANPEGLISQQKIDEAIAEAQKLNDENRHEEALQLIQRIVTESGGKAVKPRLFLARQYLLMSSDYRFREKSEEYSKQAELIFFQARAEAEANHETYPDNAKWVGNVQRIDLKEQEIPTVQTLSEQEVDKIIEDVLAGNKRQYYTKGREKLQETDAQIGGKSAKLLYHLAKQNQLLAATYRAKRTMFTNEAKAELERAVELKLQHTEQFTTNELWADKAKELLEQISAGSTGAVAATAEEGTATTSTGFGLPTRGRITSPYGMRVHPIYRTRRMHNGIDIGARRGTPIRAIQNGKIVRASTGGGYGKVIGVKYDNGYGSLYAHLQNFSGDAGTSRVGMRVRKGQIIGHVNSTGASTGDHLHFEITKPNGQRTGPAEVLGKRNVRGEQF